MESKLVVVLVGILVCIRGQDLVFTAPADTQYIPSSYNQNNQNYNPFRQTPSGFQALDPYRDLQTSHLPFHLQQTLPQYRSTTRSPPLFNLPNQFSFQTLQPAPFRPRDKIAASTHRPNYSHLFSHAHNRNPEETETFLGEITLQNPADLPPLGNGFGQKSEAYTRGEDLNQNIEASNEKSRNFLNHRSRFLAPSGTGSSKKSTLVKDYFVNNNGDVFISTRIPFVPKPTTAPIITQPTERKNPFSPSTKTPSKPLSFNIRSNKVPFVPKNPVIPRNSIDLEPLLEEPIKDNKASPNNDDVVEVIKSKDEPNATESSFETTTDYDYEAALTEKLVKPDELEYTDSEEADYHNTSHEEYLNSDEEDTEETTTKQNFIDHGEEEEEEEEEEEATERHIETTFKKEDDVATTTVNSLIEQPAVVFSVVTTKSVVNNTILPGVTPLPTSTIITENENTTDTWVVVASVQTSRSISGARYLPSNNVKQDERVKLLNEEEETELEITTHQQEQAELEEETTVLPTKTKTSTESLIDKLDRVQSDLSSSLLSNGFQNDNNIAVITENSDKIATTVLEVETTSTTTKAPRPAVQIRKFSPLSRPPTTARPKKVFNKNRFSKTELPQGDQPQSARSSGITNSTKILVQDVGAFLPAGFKSYTKDDSNGLVADILRKAKESFEKAAIETKNRTSNLIDGLKAEEENSTKAGKKDSSLEEMSRLFSKPKLVDDINALLPPGYKPSTTTSSSKTDSISNLLQNAKPIEDIAALLPPGYKPSSTTTASKNKELSNLLQNAKPIEDISSLLPPGYKPSNEKSVSPVYKPSSSTTTPKPKSKGYENLLADARPIDVGAFLPPGFKGGYKSRTTPKPLTTEQEKIPTSLLPPGFKPRDGIREFTPTTSSPSTTTPGKASGFKVVFPSRPGGNRKSPNRLTTPKTVEVEEQHAATAITIQKGWPSRATTEFTGWPTPSTTPISIEKLLEAARAVSTSTTEASDTSTTTRTTTTTTTTTTTPKPTTPGVCISECDLAGTIKLIGGVKWQPELIDRNTKEWQLLANEVQTQLEEVFGNSKTLNKWFKKIRIDGFTEGSVLVDYLVELNDLGRHVNTVEVKKLFHESLSEAISSNREAKALNETLKAEERLNLGRFTVDPKYTDFIVLPKEPFPTVGFAEDNVLLPQWAIAVIVIGLASLLFVIIFGVTVLVNRQKNSKKKTPIPLTEDMLNELNKNHMGGIDNYGAEDLYNMEDVWNERGYDPKLPKKRSSGSIHDNSMSNLYDSWRSEWNGYYYNAYYGNNPGSSSHGGYGRRRSDYDTNF